MANDSTRRPQSHLGQGISFPLRINRQGSLEISAAHDSIEESILIILLTNLGERVYRPDFGSRLSSFMFEPLSSQMLMLMRIAVEEALERWEPRIVVREVLTDPDPVEGRVNIQIQYQLKGTYDQRSLIYPFYLKTLNE